MLELMYELPSNDKVNKVQVTRDSILGKSKPAVFEGERNKNNGALPSNALRKVR